MSREQILALSQGPGLGNKMVGIKLNLRNVCHIKFYENENPSKTFLHKYGMKNAGLLKKT